MEVKAITKFVRISPLKARDVARNIQGLPVSQALDMLTYTPRKAAYLVGKTLKSAIANAENNHDLAVDSLVIKEAVIGDGPTIKRWKPRARGGAAPIKKRTSHIFITVSDEIEQPESTKKSGKTKKKQRMARATATGKLIEQMEKERAKGAAAVAKAEAVEEAETPEVEAEADAAEAVQEEAPAAVEEPAAEEAVAEEVAAVEDEVVEEAPAEAEASAAEEEAAPAAEAEEAGGDDEVEEEEKES
ncbi:MAG: 50S ribosomal protein L22 [Verrucomicrobiota bacterium]